MEFEAKRPKFNATNPENYMRRLAYNAGPDCCFAVKLEADHNLLLVRIADEPNCSIAGTSRGSAASVVVDVTQYLLLGTSLSYTGHLWRRTFRTFWALGSLGTLLRGDHRQA